MNTLPTVSVITVCRNCLPQLRATFDNVARQQYERLEYIIVDGASTDGTVQFLQSQQLARWTSEPDAGIYDAMNKGMERASGEWCIFMNAGDTFAADDVLQRIFSTPREADVVYGDVVKGTEVKRSEPPHNAHRMFFCHQSALVRTACLREYPFDTRHRMSADFKQMKQLLLSGKRFCQLDFAVARFDTTGISNTSRSKGLLDNIRVIRETDRLPEQMRLLPRLWLVYAVCRLRGK